MNDTEREYRRTQNFVDSLRADLASNSPGSTQGGLTVGDVVELLESEADGSKPTGSFGRILELGSGRANLIRLDIGDDGRLLKTVPAQKFTAP